MLYKQYVITVLILITNSWGALGESNSDRELESIVTSITGGVDLSKASDDGDLSGRSFDDDVDLDGRSNDDDAGLDGRSNDDDGDLDGRSNDDDADLDGRSNDDDADLDGRSNDDDTDLDGRSTDDDTDLDGRSNDDDTDLDGRSVDDDGDLDGRSFDDDSDLDGRSIDDDADLDGRNLDDDSDLDGRYVDGSTKTGGSCYSDTRQMYFPKETQKCCELHNFPCKFASNQDVWCIMNSDELETFGECCKSKGGGKYIKVSPNVPEEKECVSKIDELVAVALTDDIKH